MTEIRVCWNVDLAAHRPSDTIQAGAWFADTAQNREDLETVIESGNFAYGEGTHWLEVREVTG